MPSLILTRSSIRCALLLAFLTNAGLLLAQTQPVVGLRDNTPRVHAFLNARIVKAPGETLERGTLVIRDGLVAAVGNVPVPKDARVWDLEGMTIYPGLINSYSEYGMPKPPERSGQRSDAAGVVRPAVESQRGATFWNDAVCAHQEAAQMFIADPKEAEKLRSQGFTTALVVPRRGIFKGTSAVVSLGEGTPRDLVLRSSVAQHVSLEVDRFSEKYPTSLMGVVALLRQTLYDAVWYRDAQDAHRKRPGLPRPEENETLAALRGVIDGRMPLVIETTSEWDALRAEETAREFKVALLLRGSGREYRRLDAVAGLRRAIILPFNFPKAPAVQTHEDALQVSLEELRSWEEMPENPARLRTAGVPLAFTTMLPGDSASFLSHLRKAVERGLRKDDALAALTTAPAQLFGVEDQLGALTPGRHANFIITTGDLFSGKTVIRENWIDGKRYEVKPAPEIDPRGTWRLAIKGSSLSDSILLVLDGEPDSLRGTVRVNEPVRLTYAALSRLRISVSFPGETFGASGTVRMTAVMGAQELHGTGEWPDGKSFVWHARRTGPHVAGPDTTRQKKVEMASYPPVFPYGEYGRRALPEQPAVVMVRNATLWTCGPQGVIQNGDVIFRKGKTADVGRDLPVPSGAVVIDGTGKHVTPGIIDAHSHMGADGGLNETGFAISAEVRVGDVLDPEDINLYRNLAGGLTVAHILHGSANPIGGQNQLVKLRWGGLPEQMKFEKAPSTIKFALGENVKQSNWRTATPRYPQTRMGVEQLMRDEFRAALDYEKAWQHFRENPSDIPPRRDLRLDAALDVLRGRTFVHCHAYRQDEILSMMRIAEDFGFRIRTFEHILEGYKVADVMAKHGAGGSSFTDWWAYKFEVYDAIPYNAALMHEQGVLVSFNSDSDELSRRLNLEAAKAVKYGGLSEEEALKLVTINPAKQLFVDNRVGSLESGKDADFVVWSGHPLSNYTVCEQTWIDGRRYFDREEDRQLREEAAHQRAAIIQKILKLKAPVLPAPLARSATAKEAAGLDGMNSSEEVQP